MSGRQRDALRQKLESLFNEFQQPILGYIHRMVGDLGEAEDLTQEVFLRAYRALPDLPVDANHRAWLYRIAGNLARDRLRRRKLLQWLPLRDEAERPDQDRPQEDVSSEQEAIQRALLKLSPTYRAPLILFSVQGYSIREISAFLGISEGAVKVRLSRARERFRKAYAKEQG